MQAGLDRAVIRIAGLHAGEEGERIDGIGVAVAGVQIVRVGEEFADHLVAGIGKDQRGFRAVVGSGGRVFAERGDGDVDIGGGARPPAFDAEGARAGFLRLGDGGAEGLAGIGGE